MRNRSLYLAAALILTANLIALVHAARNRSGQGSPEIVLTERELSYWTNADNSGVTLSLRVGGLYHQWFAVSGKLTDLPGYWLNEKRLQTLGFDCKVDANASNAREFYLRQVPRAVFVALEFNGPAWVEWLDSHSRDDNSSFEVQNASRLVAFDAAPERGILLARYRDKPSVIVVPAEAQIVITKTPASTSKLVGNITQIPTAIHVPKPFSEPFQAIKPGTKPTYRVHLKYGSFSEPWVTAVEVDPVH